MPRLPIFSFANPASSARKALGLSLILWLTGTVVLAAEVKDLFEAAVVVPDRSEAALNSGASAALAGVLVKLSGQRDAPRQQGAANMLRQARQWMLQYRFEDDPATGDLNLIAAFDEAAVRDAMRAAGMPVWGSQRPDTLVWLIVDSASGRTILGGQEISAVRDALMHGSSKRGIPVLLPLVDIEESAHLTHAGDWSGLLTAALALSDRYGTSSTLVGHARQILPELWETEWSLRIGSEQFNWREEGSLIELLVEDSMDRLGDALASRYANPEVLSRTERLVISISGISSGDNYARVQQHLEGLDIVQNLFVRSLDRRTLAVELTALGGLSALTEAISFGRVLRPDENQPLNFSLVP